MMSAHRTWSTVFFAALLLLPIGRASAEEGRRKRTVIQLEEITFDSIIREPSVFFQLAGPGGGSLIPAPAVCEGSKASSPACAAFLEASTSWDEMVERQQRLAAQIKALRADQNDTAKTLSARRPLPVLQQLGSAIPPDGPDVPLMSVTALGGPARDIDHVVEALLQGRGALVGCPAPARLLVEVAPDGRVRSARPDGPSESGECVARIIGEVRFPASATDETSWYGVFFHGPPPDSAREGSPQAQTPETFPGISSPNIVRRILIRHMDEIRACYARSLRTTPDLEGRLSVTIRINVNGCVASVQENETALPPEVVSCVLERLQSIRFPPPEGGSTTITHTFLFQP